MIKAWRRKDQKEGPNESGLQNQGCNCKLQGCQAQCSYICTKSETGRSVGNIFNLYLLLFDPSVTPLVYDYHLAICNDKIYQTAALNFFA